MSNIDEQFVEYIVKSLVGNPDGVKIDRTIDEKGVLLKLSVDQEDLGRVIGKRGATAQSIRTLLRALGTKNDARYNLKIVDPQQGERPAPASNDDSADEPADEEPVADEQPVSEEPAEEPEVEEKTEDEDANAVEDVESEPQEAVDEEEESLADKTRKELDDLDDLEI